MTLATQPELRLLGPTDVEAYRDLRLSALVESSRAFCQSYEDEKDRPPEYFAACIGQGEHLSLGAFIDDVLIGFVSLIRDGRSKARHKAALSTMYVAPQARGRSIGGVLLAETIARAKAMPGLEQIYLWVLDPERSSARRLYAQAGFKAQGAAVRDDLRIDGCSIDAEYMTLSWTCEFPERG